MHSTGAKKKNRFHYMVWVSVLTLWWLMLIFQLYCVVRLFASNWKIGNEEIQSVTIDFGWINRNAPSTTCNYILLLLLLVNNKWLVPPATSVCRGCRLLKSILHDRWIDYDGHLFWITSTPVVSAQWLLIQYFSFSRDELTGIHAAKKPTTVVYKFNLTFATIVLLESAAV